MTPESPQQPDASRLEKIKPREDNGVMLEIAMAIAEDEKEDLPLYKNEIYLAWAKKREALADVDNESEDRDKARLELDLDRLEILIMAGLIESARVVSAEIFEALGATEYEDLFERFYDLDESLSS